MAGVWKRLDAEMQDECDAEVRRVGLSPGDFTIDHMRNDFQAVDGNYTIHMTIRVMHQVRGVVRTYQAGHGTTWPAPFVQDLAAGVFGRP